MADFRAPAGVRGGRRRDDARRAAGGTARHGATDPEGRQTAATRDRRGEARDEGSGGKRLDSPDGARGRRRACEETGVSAPLSQAPPVGPRPPRLPAALTPATKTPRPENPRPPSPHPTESARRASTHPSASRGGTSSRGPEAGRALPPEGGRGRDQAGGAGLPSPVAWEAGTEPWRVGDGGVLCRLAAVSGSEGAAGAGGEGRARRPDAPCSAFSTSRGCGGARCGGRRAHPGSCELRAAGCTSSGD